MLIAGIAAARWEKNALSADVDVEQAAVAPTGRRHTVAPGGITEESIAHQCAPVRRERARTRKVVGSGPCRIVGWRERGRICRGTRAAGPHPVPPTPPAPPTAPTPTPPTPPTPPTCYRSANAAYTAHSADATNPANTTDAAGTSRDSLPASARAGDVQRGSDARRKLE